MLSQTSSLRIIQESKFDEAHNEAENFAMLDGEGPKELHRCLLAL
jgi:hypothetical protein